MHTHEIILTKHIGRRLKIARETNGYSQAQVGAYLGISYQQYQKYETGKNRVSAATLYRLTHFFNTPLEAFFW